MFSQMLSQIHLQYSFYKGLERFVDIQPDVIIALGGGSAMDAAKAIWMFFEYPDVSFFGAKQKFLDIRKRTYKIPYAQKTQFICIPTTSGTGSEVTSFAVIPHEKRWGTVDP